ncbi:CASP-like protein UU5 [Podospora australis]|uniref:CASP-like protein UU5 n=1 Tax=Podospora australis TaxID=1536484 RepID=A0AAN7ALQ2_9PEZI|nr:CASP-like protein UU5 [Podospora australis]
MALAEILSIILRLAELAFAAVVAGLNGDFLHASRGASSWDLARHIYTEVVAGLSILFAIVWLFPFSGSFIHYPADFFLSILWFIAFGLLVDWLNGSCGYIFDWGEFSFRDTASCSQFKAVVAFAFLSAICWLVSAILGLYWTRRHTRTHHTTTTTAAPTYHRRRWYRSRV